MTVPGHDQAPMAPTGNRILDSLPPADRAQVLPKLTLLQLPYGQQLYGLGARVTHVYFPRTALISELVVLSDGRQIEVAAIGRHGFLGLRVAMGVEVETLVSVTQVPGEAWAMEATEFQAALAALPGLRRLVAAYSVVRFIQVAQFAACHALHSLRQRCARTLLEVSDQVGADDFFITQVSGRHARRPSSQRDRGAAQAAAGGTHQLPPRAHPHPPSGAFSGDGVRVLSLHHRRDQPAARRGGR
jgi:CRP-like cAMP-binding protein